ncbi:MAG: hypothetical protein HY885_15545 [Deltaproteobacteria bacterium]|nr:hypothetical protein [Deltaproteobacteria bacterium]
MPRLGTNDAVSIEVIAKPRQEYQTMAYADLGLPKAPAVMIGKDIIVEGRDIDEQELDNIIRQRMAHK